MILRDEAGAFLRSRRRRLDPDRVGLVQGGSPRRRVGLRRSEVAMLASISTQYYTRMEQGHLAGVSEEILLAVADALELDAAERWHLLGLARAQQSARFRAWMSPDRVRPETQLVLDSLNAPALVLRLGADVIASNEPARAAFSPLFGSPFQPPNNARFVFLDPAARQFFANWESEADAIAAILHTRAAHFPDDAVLARAIAELRERSADFALRWKTYPVTMSPRRVIEVNHPLAGRMVFFNETLALAEDQGLYLVVRIPAPRTGTAEAVDRLIARGGGVVGHGNRAWRGLSVRSR
ncbi:MAG: helix-turn-helix transcriptional regulator [Bifidobacteriaceae bacterium]|jgi:transcriptional regulator with XRE-family HTH domain|nr:helix-turn-helix transcriptional regulator [Bifidobacteriaceae bacterium]